jgi:hypothetical protein
MTTYFDALGVAKTATAEEIKAAYRKMAMELHPDRTPENALKFRLVTDAYNELSRSNASRENARWGIFGANYRTWQKEYDEAFGIVKPAEPKSQHETTIDDINEFIRRMERMRAQAKAQKYSAVDICVHPGCYTATVPGWKYCSEHSKKTGNSKSEPKADAPKQDAPKPGACGAQTKSGPCCRPAGHTPNGHMSQKVADQKRANQRARQQKN